MHTRYRIPLAALAFVALFVLALPFTVELSRAVSKTTAPQDWADIRHNVSAFARYLGINVAHAATPAQQADDTARQAATTAPLTLADFAGRWGSHGLSLTLNPDGSGDADWRRGGAGVDIGRATLRAERVDGRTLYGTVLTTNYQDGLVRGPFELTEYDYGIGVLSDARVLGARAIGAPDDQFPIDTLCGPRYEGAPDWFKRIRPCGA